MSDLIIPEPEDDFSGKRNLPARYSLEDIKSIIFFFKQSRDTDIKVYDDNKIFSLNDILDLNARVKEKLRITDNITVTTKTVVALATKEVQNFGNWESFKTYDWQSVNEAVESIVLDWDFTVLIPNQKTFPQTHTLKVRIGSELRPNELFHLFMEEGEDFEVLEASSQMICKVDFINALLAKEYKNLVTNWYDGLPKNEPTSFFVAFFKKK